MTWRDDLPTAIGTVNAGSAVPAATSGYRITAVNAYATSYKPSFDDKIFSAEITFKWPPFDKNGNPNKKEESTIQTTGILNTTSTPTSL